MTESGRRQCQGRKVAEVARAIVERDYASADGCSVAGVATRLDISPSLLCHHYVATHGITIGQYVRRLRIRKACALLASRQPLLMKEVAAEMGYSRQSYRAFLNAFRAETGMLPSRFRIRALNGTPERAAASGT